MSVACYSVLTGGGTNQELALHCLHDCRGDVIVSRPHCPAVSSFIFCYFLPLALFISLCFSRTLSLSHPYTHTHTHTHTHTSTALHCVLSSTYPSSTVSMNPEVGG